MIISFALESLKYFAFYIVALGLCKTLTVYYKVLLLDCLGILRV